MFRGLNWDSGRRERENGPSGGGKAARIPGFGEILAFTGVLCDPGENIQGRGLGGGFWVILGI